MPTPPVSPNPPLLSIVVPAGPGERAWRTLLDDLDSAREALTLAPVDIERIISACGPRPRTLEDIETIWLEGSPGRAAQLNRGLAAARGDVLWLLHADSRVNEIALKAAWRFALDPPDALGWFRLAFASDGPIAARLNAIGANLRSRWLGLPFGDQGLLISREVLDRIGGFDEEFGLGEDLEFVVRARRLGIPARPVNARLTTSARRYRDHGWTRTTLSHLGLTLQLWRKARVREKTQGSPQMNTDEHR